jgi:elongation factor 1-beta
MADVSAVLNGVPSSDQQLRQLDEHLSKLAYINGFLPSAEDFYVFGILAKTSISSQNYPHLSRWHRHLESFSVEEQSAWPSRGTGKINVATPQQSASKQAPTSAAAAAEDDFDLFGDDDSDDEEKKKITEERLKAYAEKKAKKAGPIAKSTVIYDVKPWDDTIDIQEIEKNVRSITADGLVWGTSKIEPIAFGIKKLQICCCVEDEKISTDWLEEQITGFEDLVQSVDVVAFNKV